MKRHDKRYMTFHKWEKQWKAQKNCTYLTFWSFHVSSTIFFTFFSISSYKELPLVFLSGILLDNLLWITSKRIDSTLPCIDSGSLKTFSIFFSFSWLTFSYLIRYFQVQLPSTFFLKFWLYVIWSIEYILVERHWKRK